MSMLLCTSCDRLFDTDDQVEAQYDPPVCEDCLLEREQEFNQWVAAIDADPEWIEVFLEENP